MYALLADTLTLLRVVAAGVLIWLGVAYSAEKLPVAVLVTVLAWTTDQLDGWAARRSATPTRLGVYDFSIDVFFYLGMLSYLVTAGFAPAWAALLFLGVATAAWISTRRKAIAILCLRIIDLYTGVVVFIREPLLGFVVLAWLMVLAVLYRKRLAERVPRWLHDIRTLGQDHPEAHSPEKQTPI